MSDLLIDSAYAKALFTAAGMQAGDFSDVLAIYKSDLTDRIVVVCRDPLHGNALLIPAPANLFRTTHVGESGDGQTTFYFDPIKPN